MKYIDLQYAFETETASLDNYLTDKIPTYDILYWLNQAVYKFIKTRYNGNNALLTAFEQDEKRSRDLINLYKIEPIAITRTEKNKYTEFEGTFPDDVMFILDEYVEIYHMDTPEEVFPTEIFECTLDSYMYRITNTLTDFHWHNKRARPLRVRTTNGAKLLTDQQYEVFEYKIGYIREPQKITLDNPFEEYSEFPDYAQLEIVKLAAQMYVENSSNTARYQTINNEVSQME